MSTNIIIIPEGSAKNVAENGWKNDGWKGKVVEKIKR